MNRISKLFQPINAIPKHADLKNSSITSKSQKLMLELGIIRQSSPGSFHLLPLGVRAINKLTNLVDEEMSKIDAQKVIFPTLTHTKLWKMTGRLDQNPAEHFTLKDRHDKKYILSPTHEESAADLLSSISPISYKQFPIRLYQVTSKFRDEMKPRFGLMRARQFLMKDLYAFDVNMKNAKETYDAVCNSYDEVFRKLGISYLKVAGSCGNMGGTLSHEYHFPSEVGEDKLLECKKCNAISNVELCNDDKVCPQCNSSEVQITHGIEVGHTFLLGEKYSKPLKVTCTNSEHGQCTVQMGSYGLGLSRILAASIEVLSLEHEIRWPNILAPFQILIIPPKSGSKEESNAKLNANELYNVLSNVNELKDNIIIDDRTSATIGKRALEAKRVGYPFLMILGSKSTDNPPLIEVNNLKKSEKLYLNVDEAINYIREHLK